MFTKQYWQSSARKLKDIHYLAIMAAFIAMKIIVGSVYVPVAPNLRIGIAFILVAVEASILGPVSGMTSAAITDLLGFAIFPSGPFFLGYTITAVCGSLIYSLFLYQQNISMVKIGIAKVLTNYLVNVLLGSLWSSMLYDKAFVVYAATSVVKNTILLPFEIAILIVIFNLLIPFLTKKKLLEVPTKTPIPFK